jgi:hypothetical protein
MNDLRELFGLVSRLPPRFELRMSCEREEEGDDDANILCAVIMEKPPIGGWRTRSEHFGHEGVKPEDDVPCPQQSRFSPVARVGISAYDSKTAARLTLDMVASFLEKLEKRGAL